MECPTCKGTGLSAFFKGFCALCDGMGELADDRVGNPECHICRGSGLSVFKTGFCEMCDGWGRLRSGKTPGADRDTKDKGVALGESAPPSQAEVNPSRVIANANQSMRIFVSHASHDEEVATKFVELLQLGVGVPQGSVFCTSQKETIPGGASFVPWIIEELNSANLIVALLSPRYLASHFCVAEAGVARARKEQEACVFFPLILPPASPSDLGGMLHGVQSGSLLDRPSLGKLRDHITNNSSVGPIGLHIWDQKRDRFLEFAQRKARRYEMENDLSKIVVDDYRWCHEQGPSVYVPKKLRVVLKNNLSISLGVLNARWSKVTAGIPVHSCAADPLKLQADPTSPEVSELTVPPGGTFRTWIGLREDVTGEDCLRFSGQKRTGTINLHLVIDGEEFEHHIGF